MATQADFNLPLPTNFALDVLTFLKDNIASVLQMLDGVNASNLPTNAKRYNTQSNQFETWNGTSWVPLGFHAAIQSQINAAIGSGTAPTGTITAFAGSTAPAGWLLCDGLTYNRSDYPALFAVCGTAYGAPSPTTFQVPRLVGRFPIGVDTTQAAINGLGKATGSFNHKHGIDAHTHTTNPHSHVVNSHSHTVKPHSHTIPAHTHAVAGHYHNVPEADNAVNIFANGGTHSHDTYGVHCYFEEVNIDGSTREIVRPYNDPVASRQTNAPWKILVTDNSYGKHGRVTLPDAIEQTLNGPNGSHTHTPNANPPTMQGRLGNVGGSNGDNSMATTATSLTTALSVQEQTELSQPGTSSSTVTVNYGGTPTTDAANPPCLAINFIIKT